MILEILDPDKSCSYEWSGSDPEWSATDHLDHPVDFSPRGHHVLDVGAHIGAFVRYALGAGAARVTAYEPEPSNAELLRKNVRRRRPDDDGSSPVVVVREAAVVADGRSGGPRTLVLGADRDDDRRNTWRHALDFYSRRERCGGPTVETVPFFGGALFNNNNNNNVTFVKLDCEGAEVDVLLDERAARPESWSNVSRLVAEWSFTRRPEVETFRRAMDNLERSGFLVTYEGKGSWWDRNESGEELWPYHADLIVFAGRPHLDAPPR